MAISRRLNETDDLNERISLRDRQRELRTRWAGDDINTQTTKRLSNLENALSMQLADVLDRRLDVGSTGNGSDNGGLDPLATMQHNRSVDELSGRAEIERQLLEVRSELRLRKAEE